MGLYLSSYQGLCEAVRIHDRQVLYMDDDHYLVVYDRRNFAIVNRITADRQTSIHNSIDGFYGNIPNALSALVNIKVERQLMNEIDEKEIESHIFTMMELVDRYRSIYAMIADNLGKFIRGIDND